jgi:hypothetical protein
MKVQVRTQTEEVAAERGATSFQPQRATGSSTPRLSCSHAPHPNSRSSATRTNGAPREGLLFALLSACSGQRQESVAKPFEKLSTKTRDSR